MSNEVVESPIETPSNEVVETPIETPSNEVVLDPPLENTFKLLGFRVSVVSLQLGQYAILGVNLSCMRKEEHYIEYREIKLQGEDYLAWGADDKYVMEFVTANISSLF
jgi:hypothetical protein